MAAGCTVSPSAPQVEELKTQNIEILHREGIALIALNTMLYADNVNEQLLQRKLVL